MLGVLTSQRPTLRSAAEALAAAIHAELVSSNLALVGLAESGADALLDPFPADWNANDGVYCFRYKHTASSQRVLVKMFSVGDALSFVASALDGERLQSFDLPTESYITKDADLTAHASLFQNSDALRRRIRNAVLHGVLGQEREPEPAAAAAQQGGAAAAAAAAPEDARGRDARDPLRDVDPIDPLRVGPIRRPRVGGDDLGPGGPLWGPGGGRAPGRGGMLVGPDSALFGPPGRDPGMPGIQGDPTVGFMDPDPDHLPPPGPARNPGGRGPRSFGPRGPRGGFGDMGGGFGGGGGFF